MDKPSPRDLTRRAAVLGLSALGGCAGAGDAPLPDYLFSLTAWAEGGKIDFLLVNITERPLRVINAIVPRLSVDIHDDETGAPLTDGFVEVGLLSREQFVTYQPSMARRLAPAKSFKGGLTTAELIFSLGSRLRPLDSGRRYKVAFRTSVPVVAPGGGLVFATVTARSLCTITLQGKASRTDCKSA